MPVAKIKDAIELVNIKLNCWQHDASIEKCKALILNRCEKSSKHKHTSNDKIKLEEENEVLHGLTMAVYGQRGKSIT